MGNKIPTCFKPKRPQPKRSSHNPYLISETYELHKIKPYFSHSFKWRCTNPSDFAYINKVRPKILSHINFVNHKAENAGPKALRSLSKFLKNTKRSTTLSIEDSELSFKQLEYLIDSTNYLKKVKISTLPSNRLSDFQLLKSLIRIGRNKNLCELIVSSPNQTQLRNPRIAHHVQQQLKQLKKLERFPLNSSLFWNNQILYRHPFRSLTSVDLVVPPNLDFGQKIFSHYISRLSQYNRLEHLRLFFQENHQTSSQEIQHWNSFFQKAHTLKNLKILKFFRSRQDLENFKLFLGCFESISQVKTLNLQLYAVPCGLIGDHQNTFFLCFFSHFQYLAQLQKLQFTIVGDFLLRDIHVEHLALFLQDLKNLETLELSLPQLESPSEAVISLAKSIQHPPALKHFKLQYKNDKNVIISSRAMEILLNSITHLQLKSLDLTFFDEKSNNLALTPGLAPLFRTLSEFLDLSKLSLDFPVFLPQGSKDFTLALKSLRKLSSVSLVIPQLNSANNFQDLSSFLSCFKAMPNLSSLHLTFVDEKLCNQEVEVIARNLNDCHNLNRLELFFKYAYQLNESSLDYLQAGFANLIKLEYLKIKIESEWEFNFDLVCKFLARLTFLKRLKELSFEGREIHSPLYTHYPMLEELQGLYLLKH